MIRILFLIPNLGHGGAEKVLVNLVNNMDRTKFDITVMALYDDNGINKRFLSPDITYTSCFPRSFPGVSHLLKLFSPEFLYKNLIHDRYDIVVSFLEGQTARIVSGCKNAKTACWIHMTMTDMNRAASLFRSLKEARLCYASFDRIVSVSQDAQQAFMDIFHLEEKGIVLYNVNQTDQIVRLSKEKIPERVFSNQEIKLCAMGSLIPVKGFDRLLRIHAQLRRNGYPVHTYILGEGRDAQKLTRLATQLQVDDSVTFLGYQQNPYSYLRQCDLFLCSSYSEGFSTAATEALILGTPVCTVEVSGMKELLGSNGEYGVITDNTEDALYHGIQKLLDNPQLLLHYSIQAKKRSKSFESAQTVYAVEQMLFNLYAQEF